MNIPDGFIIIASCQDECTTAMSERVKQWFEHLGSKEIRNLKYRQSYAFIGIKGKQDCQEKRSGEKEKVFV